MKRLQNNAWWMYYRTLEELVASVLGVNEAVIEDSPANELLAYEEDAIYIGHIGQVSRTLTRMRQGGEL